MRVQLNVFYNRLVLFSGSDLAPGNLAASFATIKEASQTHSGITEGTLSCDPGRRFYQIGCYIERAYQTIRRHQMPPPVAPHCRCRLVGRCCQPVQCVTAFGGRIPHLWGAASRRRVPAAEYRVSTLGPSIACERSGDCWERSSRRCRVQRGNAAKEVGHLQAVPGPLDISTILSRDLHEFLGAIQRQLIAVTLELCVAFLVYPNADHKPAIGRSPCPFSPFGTS